MITAKSLKLFRPGSVLLNTGRGALVDATALISTLKAHDRLWYVGMDVYEDEVGLFFEDLSGDIVQDDTVQLLTTYKGCFITLHTAWLTRELLADIARVTLGNASDFAAGQQGSARTV